MDRVVLVARLRSNGRERARELLARDPSSPGVEPAFDGAGIFISESEIIFFLEGRDADESVRAILNDPVRSTAISQVPTPPTLRTQRESACSRHRRIHVVEDAAGLHEIHRVEAFGERLVHAAQHVGPVRRLP
jgi:hypothetical protein